MRASTGSTIGSLKYSYCVLTLIAISIGLQTKAQIDSDHDNAYPDRQPPESCYRIKVLSSPSCSSLRVSVDDSGCISKPIVTGTRLECRNEFLAEFFFEIEGRLYRSVLTKNANSSWNSGSMNVTKVIKVSSGSTSGVTDINKNLETKSGASAPLNYWFEFRVRAENDTKTDLAKSKSPTYLRLRPGLRYRHNSKILVHSEVQASREFGSEKFVGSTNSTNLRSESSGGSYDSELSFHQGFLAYQPVTDLDFRIGRMELDFGDGLLIGSANWGNVGRSFDASHLKWFHVFGDVSAFYSKIVDRSITNDRPGNKDLSGIYLHFDLGEGLTNVDSYIFNFQNSTNLDAFGNASLSEMIEIWSYGLRMKSRYLAWDYRAEVTKQTTAVSANQWDVELGYNFEEWAKLRVFGQAFDADEDFNQLYPSGHKWLGSADILSRRNIKGSAVGMALEPIDWFRMDLKYLWFLRHSNNKAGYLFDGTSMNTRSAATEVGEEFDVDAIFQIDEGLKLQLSYYALTPGAYIKDQYQSVNPQKWLAQLTFSMK